MIKALQTELGVTADGSFGEGTLSACPIMQEVEDVTTAAESNLTYILQGSLWCKGYNPGGFTGVFGPNTTNAVKEFQADAGINEDGIVTPYILQGIMNTDGYAFTETDDEELNYKHEVQMGLNAYYGEQIGLIAPNGAWERKSHRNLIKACQIEWGTSVDGIWGSGTMNAAPTLSINTSGYTNSKRLLQWALAVNGFYADNLEGSFTSSTRDAVVEFQSLMELDADGIAGRNTRASLLVSYGNTSRTGTACDTSTRLTATTASGLKNAGYEDVGRYLVNVEGGTLDKKMTDEELSIIEAAGLKVFPIFQTYGGEASYFTRDQGRSDASEAKAAAQEFGFPPNTVIYFAVDYDALMADITDYILPYFRGINEIMGNAYKIGAYGPRAVCNRLESYGLTTCSFVSDMSSGFTGNIGVKMPSNWAYDQIVTTTAGGVSIDKCIASSRKTAISPSEFVTYSGIDIGDIELPLASINKIYNLANLYLAVSGKAAIPYNANVLALQYLRGSGYEGRIWAIAGGERDEGFINFVYNDDNEFDPNTVSIVDPDTGFEIGFPHFAATMNSCLTSCMDLSFEFLERNVDAYTGWAGDLIQMGITLERSIAQGYNYFNINDLVTLLGSTEENIQAYHLFNQNSDGSISEMTTKNSGFGLEDLYQDVDAYNVSRLYDLSVWPLPNALNDYYYVSQHCKQRFSIFKSQLLSEFDELSLLFVARPFTEGSILFLSDLFEDHFGAFSGNLYGLVLAQAFENKINGLIAEE